MCHAHEMLTFCSRFAHERTLILREICLYGEKGKWYDSRGFNFQDNLERQIGICGGNKDYGSTTFGEAHLG